MEKENNWDKYFLNICNTVADNSKCLSRKIGAIIVKDKSIISTGYNGPPRGVPHCQYRYNLDSYLKDKIKEAGKESLKEHNQCPRYYLGYASGKGLDLCIAGHAERNALINAARNGINVKGAKMYMNCPLSCKDCLIEIINSGIDEIIVTDGNLYDRAGQYLIDNSKLKLRTFNL